MQRTPNQSSYLSTPRDDRMPKPLTLIPPYSSPRIKGKYEPEPWHIIVSTDNLLSKANLTFVYRKYFIA